MQLDRAERGFSFQNDGPLDMRMDPGAEESAASWLARVPVEELSGAIRRYGEEPQAGRSSKVKFPDPGGIHDGRAMLSMLSGSQFITHITARDDCGARSG